MNTETLKPLLDRMQVAVDEGLPVDSALAMGRMQAVNLAESTPKV